MKLPQLSRDQVRQVDQIAIEKFGICSLVLMENAGRGAAEIIHQINPSGKVVILCGKGNNAGDGYVIARHLQLMDQEAKIVSIVDPSELSGDAAANAAIIQKTNVELQVATSADQLRAACVGADVIVDCLLGTGAVGELREPFSTAVAVANSLPATRVAIDVPTGLDCDTGCANEPTFCADHTITFVAEKIGLTQPEADKFVGVIHVVGIGAPRELLQQFM